MVTREELAAPVAAVSIASWILVYSPQLYETWARQSGDGLSVTFIVIWLAADALNGIGAFQQKLMPSMVVLAVYYCVCDLILLWQYYYYRHLQRVRARKHLEARARGSFGTDESTPLIAGATSDICDAEDDLDDADLDIDLTHDLAAAAAADEDVALALAEDEADEATEAEQWWIPVLKYLAAILFVVCSGLAVWALSPKLDAQPLVFTLHEGAEWRWDAQVAGWISAVLYLTSRIPQILLNRKTHCEGLSMALFIFTVLANGTYVAVSWYFRYVALWMKREAD